MSTKRDKTNSVLAEFEVVVRELQHRGMSDIEIHSMVNMIIQGWFVNGQPTKEYLELAAQALEQRRQAETQPAIVDKHGQSITSRSQV